MKKEYKLGLLFASLVVYIIAINIISSTNFNFGFNNSQDGNIGTCGAFCTKLKVGEGVSVSVVRNRWYGQIFEGGESRTLYLFKLIKLPLEKEGKDYVLFHLVFIITWIFLFIKFLNEPKNPGYFEDFEKQKDLNSLNY